MFKALFLSLSLVALTSVAAQAAVIISNPWNFDGTTDWDLSGSAAGDFSVSNSGIPRSDGEDGWQDRSSTADGDIGSELGANRRFGESDAGDVAGVAGPVSAGGTGYFITFTINNDSLSDYIIDSFSFGIGRNRSTDAYLYSSIVIGSTETALTANASESDAQLATIDWDNPLVQFGASGTANMWAKPSYTSIGLTLAAGESAAFRVYVADSDTSSTQWHFNNFEVTAIPEPGTYAAIFGLVALGGVLLRRCLRG